MSLIWCWLKSRFSHGGCQSYPPIDNRLFAHQICLPLHPHASILTRLTILLRHLAHPPSSPLDSQCLSPSTVTDPPHILTPRVSRLSAADPLRNLRGLSIWYYIWQSSISSSHDQSGTIVTKSQDLVIRHINVSSIEFMLSGITQKNWTHI